MSLKTNKKKNTKAIKEHKPDKAEHNKKIKAKAEKKKQRSIAVAIIKEQLIGKLMSFVFFDILYFVFLMAAVVFNAEMNINGSPENFTNFELVSKNPYDIQSFFCSLQVIIHDSRGVRHIFSAAHYGEFFYYTIGCIIIIQFTFMFFACVYVPIRINRKLKPLYTFTDAARALNCMDPASDEFSTLQDAINKFSPGDSNSKFQTGRKELVGLENAVNDLLERTRNSYKSQIRFVSDASHELRTPIAVIQGYANMLDRWGRDDKDILDESIKSIKSEAENMNRLVENLLFLARGDSGRTIIRFENLSIGELLCDIYDEFVMIDSKHEYCLDIRDEITAKADSSLLKQCLRILVDNAAKYSPDGTDIIIRLQKRDEKSFDIEVQDYGIGIKSEDADKIFERFYRSDPARNRQNGGTGLGLSIAKWIADKHNAYFELLSYEGIGTRMTLVMPLTDKTTDISESKSENEIIH